MANATAPYDGPKGKTIDVDPDDINYIVWDVTKDLSDRGTTAASVVMAPGGAITVSQGPTIQGTVVVAMLQMDVSVPLVSHYGTVRVTCADGQRFDRTIYFNLEDH
jgi:hypothetical protein